MLPNASRAAAGLLLILLALVPMAAKAQDQTERLESYRKQAWLLLEKGKSRSAAEAFRKVRRQEPSPTFSAAIGHATALNRTGLYGEAAEVAEEAMELAASQADRVSVQTQRGIAAYAGGAANPRGLRRAEESFRQVLEQAPEAVPGIRYLLGLVLLKLEHDDEGVELMRQYLENEPEGDSAELARMYVENPGRARVPILPPFEAMTMDGQKLSTQSLAGKVVLFDFWGTWCKPCRAAIPHLRELAQDTEDDPFVIVGVANDSSALKLRDFLRDHDMDWPQIHDPNRQLTTGIFGVASYPTYVLVDHEGVIIFRKSAWSRKVGSQVTSEVERAIKKARERR